MTIINSKEFVTNQSKYFNLAVSDDVVIKRGKNRFHLRCRPVKKISEYDEVLEPDEDFYRAITIDELRKRVKEDIHQWYKEKNESISIT